MERPRGEPPDLSVNGWDGGGKWGGWRGVCSGPMTGRSGRRMYLKWFAGAAERRAGL
jgi:hypothetical protein